MPMMIPTGCLPKLSCISPQLLCDVVETMKLLATRGRLEAAADLAHFLGTLDANPLTSGSPRRRRRKRRRKHSRRHYLAADMASEQHRQSSPPHHWAARRLSGWVRRAHCRAPKCPPCGPMPNPTAVQLIASVLNLFVYCYILVNKHVQLRSWVSLDDGPSVLVTWSQRLRSEATSPKRLLTRGEDGQ